MAVIHNDHWVAFGSLKSGHTLNVSIHISMTSSAMPLSGPPTAHQRPCDQIRGVVDHVCITNSVSPLNVPPTGRACTRASTVKITMARLTKSQGCWAIKLTLTFCKFAMSMNRVWNLFPAMSPRAIANNFDLICTSRLFC
jgi:hypothetical protein